MPNFVTKAFNKAVRFQPVKTVIDDLAVMDVGSKTAYLGGTAVKAWCAAMAVGMLPNSEMTTVPELAAIYLGSSFLQGMIRDVSRAVYEDRQTTIKGFSQRVAESLTWRVI